MKWEKVKLGELYEVHNGLSKAGKFFGEGYPFLTFSTVFNNYFIPKQITDLVQSTEKEQESYSIRRGDPFHKFVQILHKLSKVKVEEAVSKMETTQIRLYGTALPARRRYPVPVR